jgi:hypothetical protein
MDTFPMWIHSIFTCGNNHNLHIHLSCILWLEIIKNPEVWAWSCTLKGRLFIWDPLLSWSLRLLGHALAQRCQLKNGINARNSLVTRLKLCNKGSKHSASNGCRCLILRKNTNGDTWQTYLQLKPIQKIGSSKPYSHQKTNIFSNPTHCNKLPGVLQRPHTPLHWLSCWMPSNAEAIFRGLILPIHTADGNIIIGRA